MQETARISFSTYLTKKKITRIDLSSFISYSKFQNLKFEAEINCWIPELAPFSSQLLKFYILKVMVEVVQLPFSCAPYNPPLSLTKLKIKSIIRKKNKRIMYFYSFLNHFFNWDKSLQLTNFRWKDPLLILFFESMKQL